MFTKIRLKNFYSFKDVEFDLNKGRQGYKPLAIIYGENGSGKTNLASGLSIFIDLMRTMDVRDIIEQILYEQEHPQNTNMPMPKLTQQMLGNLFRTSESLFRKCRMVGSSEPTSLDYEFVVNGKRGSYSLQFGEEGITHEHLEYAIDARRGIYFDLSNQKKKINPAIIVNQNLKNDLIAQLQRFWGKHSFLAIIIHEINDKSRQYTETGFSHHFLELLEAFSNISCDINDSNPYSLISLRKNNILLADLEEGTLAKKDIAILEKTETILTRMFQAINSYNINVYYERREINEEQIKYRLRIIKLMYGRERDLPFEYESYGNRQIIKMLPFLLRSMNGGTVILDESDAGIHDLLYLKIIGNALQYINGQLILTSHNTLLLDLPDIKDAVYIIKENEKAEKVIIPISSSGERIYQQTNLKQKYLSGTYGGIPQVKDIDFGAMVRVLDEKDNTIKV